MNSRRPVSSELRRLRESSKEVKKINHEQNAYPGCHAYCE
jgi:hypothetical protein